MLLNSAQILQKNPKLRHFCHLIQINRHINLLPQLLMLLLVCHTTCIAIFNHVYRLLSKKCLIIFEQTPPIVNSLGKILGTNVGENLFFFNSKKNKVFSLLFQWMKVLCTCTYLHLKDGVLTFSSGIMHEFKVLLKFLCHDEDDMLTSVTLLQNFAQWSSIFSEWLFFFLRHPATHTCT